MKTNTLFCLLAASVQSAVLMLGTLGPNAVAQETNGPLFTYQGVLVDNGIPFDGLYDLQFALYGGMTNSVPLGSVVDKPAVALNNGLFMVDLPVNALGPQPEPPDYSVLLEDDPLWLEIRVRAAGSQDPFLPLGPRQKLIHAPRAAYAGMARVALTVPDGAITDAKLGTNAIQGWAIGQQAVETRHLADGAVTRHKLPDGVIDSDALANNAVTSDKLAMDAVMMGHIADYSVTGPKIADGSVVRSVNGRQENLMFAAGSGLALNISSNLFTLSAVRNCADYASCYWSLLGNSGTTAGTHFLGTTDDEPLELKVYGKRALRLEPNSSEAPNLIGGAGNNFVGAGVIGATIAGGGAVSHSGWGAIPNRVLADFGSIGGGSWHLIETGASSSTIAGGFTNAIGTNANAGTIGGGRYNGIGTGSRDAVIAGGYDNDIGEDADYSVVSGGTLNRVGGNVDYAMIPGGLSAQANSYGQFVHASGQFGAAGDAQASVFVLRRLTTTGTATELYLDGSSSSRRLTVPLNSTWTFDILITARTQQGLSAGYQVRGLVENEAGFTTVRAASKTVLYEDVASWDVAVEADGADNHLIIRVTGSTGYTVRWVASVRTVEVTFP